MSGPEREFPLDTWGAPIAGRQPKTIGEHLEAGHDLRGMMDIPPVPVTADPGMVSPLTAGADLVPRDQLAAMISGLILLGVGVLAAVFLIGLACYAAWTAVT